MFTNVHINVQSGCDHAEAPNPDMSRQLSHHDLSLVPLVTTSYLL